MYKMNKLMIAALASLFSLVMVAPAVAQVASDGNMPDWQSMSPTELLWAAKNLAGADPAVVTARQSLAGNVAARFLADPAATRTLSLSQWGEFATYVSADLTVDQRGQWIGKIRAAYVQDPTGLASLKTPDDLGSLISILGKLGDKQAGNVAGTFTLSTTAWQSWQPAQLADLSRKLSTLASAGAEARLAVAGTVTSKYLSAESAKSVNLSQWNDLVKFLASGLSAEAKAQWAAAIAQTVSGTGEAAVSLSAKDTEQLTSMFNQLGAKDLAVQMVIRLSGDAAALGPMSAGQIISAIDKLTGSTEPVKAARQALAQHVATKFLADGSSTVAVSFYEWRKLASRLAADLTAEQKGQWVGRFRAGYLGAPAGLASLKTPADLGSLIGLLGQLGDSQAKAAALTFAQGSSAWQSWSSPELVDLAKQLAALGDSGAGLQKTVADTVVARYQQADAVKSMNLAQWLQFNGRFAPLLTDEAKAKLAASIAQAFAGTAENPITLSPKDTRQLSAILNQLGAKESAGGLIDRLSGNVEILATSTADDLFWALQNAKGDSQAAQTVRQNIGSVLGLKFLADPAATRSVLCSQWKDFAKGLLASLTAEQKTQWIAQLRRAFVQDAEGLASLKSNWDVGWIIEALSTLGDEQATSVAASFVQGTMSWQAWHPEDVVGLAGRVSVLGDAGAKARQAMMAFVTATYTSAESAKSLTLVQWKHLSGSLRGELSAEAKAQLASAVARAYSGGGEAAGALKAQGVQDLVTVLASLSAGNLAADTMASLVNGSTAWQTWNLDSQIWLIGVLTAPDKREATKPARLKILEHITAACMPTNEEARKVPPLQWASLVMGLYDVMPEETSTLWAERLRGVFDSATLASLGADAKQRRALLPIVAILDEKMKTGLALSWLKDKTLWQGAPIGALTALAVSAYRDNRDETLPILVDLDKYCVARHATQPLTLDECLALRGMHLKVGQLPKAQQWVLVGCDVTIGTAALRAAADQSTVVKLSLALVDTGLVGPDKDATKLAATAAAVAAKGGLTLSASWQPRCLSEALCTAESRQIVRDGLLDSAGNPRAFISDTLSWAYASSGKVKEWAAYLDDQISRAPDGSDKKLLWQIARAHAEAARFRTYSALAGKKWLDDALASAKEPRQRFMVVEELARGHLASGTYDKGIGALKDLAASFAETEFAPAIVKLQADLQGARDKEQVAKTRAAAEARRMHLEELQRRLAEAKAKKDAEAIQRLERLLGVEEP